MSRRVTTLHDSGVASVQFGTMRSRTVRRSTAVLLAASVLLALTGCDMVRSGAKCRNGAAPGRDATHVLFCQKGKWTRVMTIGRAAELIMATWPAKVDVVNGAGQSATVGTSFGEVSVRVTRKDGSPVKGADVVFSGPASGPSLAASSGLVATDADGVARFVPTANGLAGGFAVTATVNGGTSPSTTFGLNNNAGAAAKVVVESGAGQTTTAGAPFASPLVVRTTDQYGNPVGYQQVAFTSQQDGPWYAPSTFGSDGDGRASTTANAGNIARTEPVTVTLVSTGATTTFSLNVVAGAVANNTKTSGDNQTVNGVTGRFNNPLVVALSDMFGNPVKNYPVTYTVVPNGSSGGTLDATTVTTDDSGLARGWVAGNGVAGTFTVEATVAGVTHEFTLTI